MCACAHMSASVCVYTCMSVCKYVCVCVCVWPHPRLSPRNTGPPLMLAALTGDVAQCTLYPPSSGYVVLSGYWFWYIISLDVTCFVTYFLSLHAVHLYFTINFFVFLFPGFVRVY